MSVLIAIVFLALNVGNSGGAIKPVVTFTPNWGNILYYDDVTLTCQVPSTELEEPPAYSWYRNRTRIGGNQPTLHIVSSSVERDSGDYQCQANGSDISDPVFLNVTKAYVILQRPPSAIYEGDPLTLRCHHVKDFISINTAFYRDDQEIQSSNTNSEYHIPRIDTSLSGLYKCTKQIHGFNSSSVHECSDMFPISVKETNLRVPVIAAAVIGSLVAVMIFAGLIWRCKSRRRSAGEESHQAEAGAVNTADPDPEDFCYTYLEISPLPKGTKIRQDELNVTYATVNKEHL